jgi:F0F1-type ATP synthase membrane subunit a
VNQTMLQYSYLQVLDFMTTVAFLLQGVQEGNPLVRLALRYAPNPLGGLLLIKLLAVALGIYCWKVGKQRLLTRMNVMFAVVVAWNLGALILGSVA